MTPAVAGILNTECAPGCEAGNRVDGGDRRSWQGCARFDDTRDVRRAVRRLRQRGLAPRGEAHAWRSVRKRRVCMRPRRSGRIACAMVCVTQFHMQSALGVNWTLQDEHIFGDILGAGGRRGTVRPLTRRGGTVDQLLHQQRHEQGGTCWAPACPRLSSAPWRARSRCRFSLHFAAVRHQNRKPRPIRSSGGFGSSRCTAPRRTVAELEDRVFLDFRRSQDVVVPAAGVSPTACGYARRRQSASLRSAPAGVGLRP